MSETDSENTKTTVRINKLKGTQNYAVWSRNVIAHLMSKGLLEALTVVISSDIIDKDKTVGTKAQDIRKVQNAWSEIYLTLTDDVQGALSPAAADAFNPDAMLLWNELKATYDEGDSAQLPRGYLPDS
ncbi:hypothetical protein QFC19_007595 [Naganishia cerealis]|uniref:Uncharacterized protein n=1 Tax=Naganishia cerealis TaxID=610337 RepID=A0ACC2V9P3_9TREE|nr:hypothetical protein QFC19_007595 [Naganishia cerealis]